MKLGDSSLHASLMVLNAKFLDLQSSFYQLKKSVEPSRACEVCSRSGTPLFRCQTTQDDPLISCEHCLEDLTENGRIGAFSPIPGAA